LIGTWQGLEPETGFESAISAFEKTTKGAQSLTAKVLWKVGYHLKRKVVFKPSFFSCHVNFSGAESLAKIFFINPKEKTQHFPGNGKVPFQ